MGNRLAWAARRGMLELDLVFQRFLQKEYEHLTQEQKVLFAELLSLPDQTLYDWILRHDTKFDHKFEALIKILRKNSG